MLPIGVVRMVLSSKVCHGMAPSLNGCHSKAVTRTDSCRPCICIRAQSTAASTLKRKGSVNAATPAGQIGTWVSVFHMKRFS